MRAARLRPYRIPAPPNPRSAAPDPARTSVSGVPVNGSVADAAGGSDDAVATARRTTTGFVGGGLVAGAAVAGGGHGSVSTSYVRTTVALGVPTVNAASPAIVSITVLERWMCIGGGALGSKWIITGTGAFAAPAGIVTSPDRGSRSAIALACSV